MVNLRRPAAFSSAYGSVFVFDVWPLRSLLASVRLDSEVRIPRY